MNGIQSLLPGPQAGPQQAPGQAQPPGQAPMPGIQPPQQQGPQRDVPSIVKQLQQSLSPAQLQALVQQSKAKPTPDGYAALAALFSDLKKQQLAQAAQGANAQQQAQQQQGTVADQILQMAQQQEPVMAAHGGMMRGYSGGGIVAFSNGGPLRFAIGSDEQGVQSGATSYPVKEEWWEKELRRMQGEEIPASEFSWWAAAKRQAAKEADMLKRAFTYSSDVEKQEERDALENALAQAYGDTTSRAKDILSKTEEQAAAPAPTQEAFRPSMNYGERYTQKPEVALPAAAQLAGEAARQKPPAAPGITGLSPAVLKELKDREQAELKAASAQLPEQEALKAALEARTKAQARESDVFERLLSGLQEKPKDLLSGDALIRLAGGISPRKGELISSAARAISGYTKDIDEYNKSIAEKRSNLMQLQASRQSAIADRNVALAEGDVTRARAAQDKITQINRYYSDLQRSLEKEMFNREMTERQVVAEEGRTEATREQARAATTSAGRETEAQQKERLLRTDPMAFAQMFGKQDKSNAFAALKEQADLLLKVNEDPLLDPKVKAENTRKINQIYQALASISGVGQQQMLPATGAPQGKVDTSNPLLK